MFEYVGSNNSIHTNLCEDIINYELMNVNLFNVACSIFLLLTFFICAPSLLCRKVKDCHKGFIKKCGSSKKSTKDQEVFGLSIGDENSSMGYEDISRSYSDKTPKMARNSLHENTKKLLFALLSWNLAWIVYQFISAIPSFPTLVLLILKTVIWIISVYLEGFVTLFIFLPIGKTEGLKVTFYVSILTSLIGGGICLGLGLFYPNSNKEYYFFDLVFSTIRWISILLLLQINCCYTNGKLNGPQKYWSAFMIITYILNSIQEGLHYYNQTTYACFRIPTKIIYFLFLVPSLIILVEYVNELWSRSYVQLFEKLASEWVEKLNMAFDEKKSDYLGRRLGSIAHSSNMSQFIIEQRDLEPISNLEDGNNHNGIFGGNADSVQRQGQGQGATFVGQGSNGTVHLYYYRSKNMKVAVKFVKMSQLLERDGVLKFKREFAHLLEVQACLNLIKFCGIFFSIGQSGPRVGLVLEYASRGSLLDILPFELSEYRNNSNHGALSKGSSKDSARKHAKVQPSKESSVKGSKRSKEAVVPERPERAEGVEGVEGAVNRSNYQNQQVSTGEKKDSGIAVKDHLLDSPHSPRLSRLSRLPPLAGFPGSNGSTYSPRMPGSNNLHRPIRANRVPAPTHAPHPISGELERMLLNPISRLTLVKSSMGLDLNNFLRYTWSFAMDCARALVFLHNERNFVFVDLKPANFVVTEEYIGKLIDLGSITRASRDINQCSYFLSSCCNIRTEKELLAWTEAYAAPEMLETCLDSSEKMDVAKTADVWSFGFFLWHCITGIRYPFVVDVSSSNWIEEKKSLRKLKECPISIETRGDVLFYYKQKGLRPPIPDNSPNQVKKLLAKCWHIDPSKRPTTTQVLEELVQIRESIKVFEPPRFTGERAYLQYQSTPNRGYASGVYGAQDESTAVTRDLRTTEGSISISYQ